MVQAMVGAELGDDVFGDDPTVQALEAEAAGLLGMEAAVFVPSGTMSNQIGLRLHVGPLEEVLCDNRAHIHNWEVGGIHAHCGAAVAAVAPRDGQRFLCGEAVREHTRSDHTLYHQPVTKLLSLENTLNGDVAPISVLAEATAAARELGLAVHLDGARLFNAAVASGTILAEYGRLSDTISICLSKGLGAPVGSVLCGSASLMRRARHFRKLYGGGMRQAGVLAAAGLYALRNNVDRLQEDHENAAFIADGLQELGFSVQRPVETNMVWCAPPPSLPLPFEELQQRLREEDGVILGGPYAGPGGRNPFGKARHSMRIVTHLDAPRSAAQTLLGCLAKHLRRRL